MSYFYYQCCLCRQFYYTAYQQDIDDAQMDYGMECNKCIELNNSIAFEVLYSELEVVDECECIPGKNVWCIDHFLEELDR